jgi:D-inositol-3-phosphate glycosyltransferase
MRIAMVSEHASPLAVLGGEDAGGQNVHVAALARALADRGHEVTVYTRRDSLELRERDQLAPGVQVVNVPAGPARQVPKDLLLPYMPQLARYMAADWSTQPPDVVHAHFWMSGLAAGMAVRSLPHDIPTIQTFHALGSVKRRFQGANDPSPPERLGIEADLLRQMTAVIATCRDEVRELLALGADAERLHVVPCGVDLDRFTPAGPTLSPWSDGKQRLLSLGRLVERKGVDSAIDALRDLPLAELVIAGGPDFGDLDFDRDARRLRARAESRGVQRQVRLIGRVDAANAAALMRAASVVLSVPWYEPFGIVPLEAMACGTPVVASAVGGMLDTVRPGRTGQLVPARDPKAIAAVVDDLFARPELLQHMGIEAAEHVSSRYSWTRVAAETEEIYRWATARGSVSLPEPVPAVLSERNR